MAKILDPVDMAIGLLIQVFNFIIAVFFVVALLIATPKLPPFIAYFDSAGASIQGTGFVMYALLVCTSVMYLTNVYTGRRLSGWIATGAAVISIILSLVVLITMMAIWYPVANTYQAVPWFNNLFNHPCYCTAFQTNNTLTKCPTITPNCQIDGVDMINTDLTIIAGPYMLMTATILNLVLSLSVLLGSFKLKNSARFSKVDY